jgi:NAD(P)-dependent dehydrogenase (short-subunit alcohol dehydrogenase family)
MQTIVTDCAPRCTGCASAVAYRAPKPDLFLDQASRHRAEIVSEPEMKMGETQSKKVALVTGGSRGLGKDIALSLAKMGIGIVLTYHSNKQEGGRVADEIRASGGIAVALQLDVSLTSSFDPFLDQLKGVLRERFGTENIDFLINNAGFGKTIPIENLTEFDFDSFVNTHFKGVVFLTQKSLAMMNDGGGVAPGGIVTDFNNAAIRGNPKAQEWIIAQTPMGRLGEAHDIGGLVALLCSDDARWLTGQRLEATGGFNL